VLAERHAGREVDAHLDGLASGRAEIVPLQIGPGHSRLLGLRHVRRQNTADDQRRHRQGTRRLHQKLAHIDLHWVGMSRGPGSSLARSGEVGSVKMGSE